MGPDEIHTLIFHLKVVHTNYSNYQCIVNNEFTKKKNYNKYFSGICKTKFIKNMNGKFLKTNK